MMLTAKLVFAWMLLRALGTPREAPQNCNEASQSCNAADASTGEALLQTAKATLFTEQVAEEDEKLPDCSFESGFCNWSNAKIGEFVWTLTAGSPPSKTTGPDRAAEGNHYVYIQTGGSGRQEGEVAILTSPPLVLPQPKQLMFKYHMYGDTMGSLTVTVDGKHVWKKKGNQGNIWHSGFVELTQYTGKNLTVAFVGESGRDAAIDAVKFVSLPPRIYSRPFMLDSEPH